MTTYHEITGTRRYEWRVWDQRVPHWSSWRAAGAALPETLFVIKATFDEFAEYEIRQVALLADAAGAYCGTLIFSATVYRQQPD